jgi:hypothetical protein
MDKKIPAIVVLAALTTEIVLGEHHEHSALVPQEHVETGVKPPAVIVDKAKSSGGGGVAVSASGVLTANDHSPLAQPHIEPPGPLPPPATGFSINQIS